MIPLPTDRKKLIPAALELIETCRASQGGRAAWYRILSQIIEAGREDGSRALINMLYRLVDKTASHLFSPAELQFTIDYESPQIKKFLEMGEATGKILTRQWERTNTDMTFARGVFVALQYGACIMKQWVQEEGEDKAPSFHKSLVMPWQFGVYREDQNELSRQPAMCETAMLTGPEVWRRIYHLPDSEKLYRRIMTHAQRGTADNESATFFHQVLSTSQLQTGVAESTRPLPGGIVTMANNPNFAQMGTVIATDLVKFQELWVQGEKDYVTIQLIEPDVLITPRDGFKFSNILIGGDTHANVHPYTLIQPNEVQGYLWGRPEVLDTMKPQELLAIWCDDVRRLFGLQIDKILAFTGDDTVTDERYDQMRTAGYLGLAQGSTVNDLTPKFPPEALPMLQFIIKTINSLGGFDNVLGGQGEPGVRAGNHAQMLMKTASPQLRDRSLLVERQCATAADLTLTLMEAKDGHNYWYKADSPQEPKAIEDSVFKLADLPDDRRVAVDSHSSSPIFADDHTQLVFAGVKEGIVTKRAAVKLLPFPQKEMILQELAEQEAREAQLIQQHPELLTAGKGGHAKK